MPPTDDQGTAPPGAPAKPTDKAEAAPAKLAELPPDLAALVANPEAFKRRLAEERAAARAAVLKDAGFDKADDLKAAAERWRAADDAAKTEAQRAADRIAKLEPRAKFADQVEATIGELLAAEEAAIPEAKRGLLDLAPAADKVLERYRWIARARQAGLFGPTAPAVAPAPATTRAGGTPPAPAAMQTGKHPRDMTPAEWAEYQRTWAAKRAAGGA